MATRDSRLAEFNSTDEPPADEPVRILCEDHVGTYVIPFPCVRRNGRWRNARTDEAIEANVIGWSAYGTR